MEIIKLVKLNCGIHYGKEKRECSKCEYFNDINKIKPNYKANINALGLKGAIINEQN